MSKHERKALADLRVNASKLDFVAMRGRRSQTAVALLMGVSQSALSILECHGPRAVTGGVLRRVLKFYMKEAEPCGLPCPTD